MSKMKNWNKLAENIEVALNDMNLLWDTPDDSLIQSVEYENGVPCTLEEVQKLMGYCVGLECLLKALGAKYHFVTQEQKLRYMKEGLSDG